jgi:transcription antitermination factor NusG
VEETEIEALQALVASGLPSTPWPYLEVGEQVRIDAGPLRGRTGILVEFKGTHRLVLSVALLQRSVAVEVDAALVKPAVLERREQGSLRQPLVPMAV